MFCSRCGTEVQPSSKFCPTCGLDLTSVTQGSLAGTAPLPAPIDDGTAVREALKDEYDLEKELGRGGMAIVYKARDRALEREVAIKVLPFSLSFDAEFVERFQREARTSAKLEHPNIIPVYRVGKSGRVIYFVMKFIRGQTLSHVIEARGALPVPEIKRLLIECGRALGYAHKHGIVHRDIKPDNIMFDELGQAIVTDFGIAKAQSGARLTGTGMSIGTPHYMSPEQARAQPLDRRSDIYSLGIVGYQCLTGHVPFNGEDSFSIGYKHIMEELPTPALETSEQRELFTVVQKMLAKKQEDRFQTAEELVVSLEGSAGVTAAVISDLAALPTQAIRPPSGVSAIATAATTPLPRASGSMAKPPTAAPAGPPKTVVPPPPARPRPAPRPVPRPRKSRAPLLVSALLAVVIVALGGYYFLVMKKPAASTTALAADSTGHARLLASADTTAGRRTDSAAAARRPDSVTAPRTDSAPAARRPDSAPSARPRTTAPRPPQRTRPKPPEVKPPPTRQPATTQAVTANPGGPPPPECERNPTLSANNPNRVCWDTRPVPLSVPTVAIPPACTAGHPGPSDILVHVTASGDVTGNPTAVRPSRCRQFDQAAMAYVLDLRFNPAKKNGQPVGTWTRVLIRPAR